MLKPDDLRTEPVSPEFLYDLICGQGSVLHVFSRTRGIHHLVDDIAVSIIPRKKVSAHVTLDPDDATGQTPMICLTTAVYEQAKAYMARILLDYGKSVPIWEELWWESGSCNPEEFTDTVLRVVLDFVALHEIGHIARGHLRKALQIGFDGIYEADANEAAALSEGDSKLRMTLELDADRTAVYSMVMLKEHLRDTVPHYARMRDDAAFIATLSFSAHLLFAMLSATRKFSSSDDVMGVSFESLHRNATHPDPSVRGEYLYQSILQLADSSERSAFHKGLNRSLEVFSRLVTSELFPVVAIRSWFYPAGEVAGFLNQLIDNVDFAIKSGWIQEYGSRFHQSISEE